jgi:hypothetical protein
LGPPEIDRAGWSVVAWYRKAVFKTIGLDDSPVEHDWRYRHADKYSRVLYK